MFAAGPYLTEFPAAPQPSPDGAHHSTEWGSGPQERMAALP
jgi:hypothetical protein